MVKTLALVLAVAGVAGAAQAAVETKVVDYSQGGVALQGLLAWDGAAKGQRPGVIVVHEWWGHNEHARRQAQRLAEAGYVAFALDMYGKGKLAQHPEDAQAFMTEATKDAAVVKERFLAALTLLKQDPHVDPKRIGAIGYCFGGGVVLGMARAGVELAAVASFHGMLATDAPAAKGAIKPRILVLTGAADAMIPPAQVAAFKQEMTAAGARFEVVEFPGAKHSFTNPDAGKFGMANLAYDADADKKSWALLLKMLAEVFGK